MSHVPIECGICYNFINISNGQELACNHYFHISCLNKWKNTCLKSGNTVSCPFCRTEKLIPVVHIDTPSPFSAVNTPNLIDLMEENDEGNEGEEGDPYRMEISMSSSDDLYSSDGYEGNEEEDEEEAVEVEVEEVVEDDEEEEEEEDEEEEDEEEEEEEDEDEEDEEEEEEVD